MTNLPSRSSRRKPGHDENPQSPDEAPTVEDRYADDGDSAIRNSHYFTGLETVPLTLPDPVPSALAAIGPDPVDLYTFQFLAELCELGSRPWVYHTDLLVHADSCVIHARAFVAGVVPPPTHAAALKAAIRKLADCGLVRTDRIKNRPGKHRTVYHCLWIASPQEGGES